MVAVVAPRFMGVDVVLLSCSYSGVGSNGTSGTGARSRQVSSMGYAAAALGGTARRNGQSADRSVLQKCAIKTSFIVECQTAVQLGVQDDLGVGGAHLCISR